MGVGGLILAVIIAVAISFGSYYASDKIVLGHQPRPAGHERKNFLISIMSSRAWPSPPESRRRAAM